jgi:hypothetical protein
VTISDADTPTSGNVMDERTDRGNASLVEPIVLSAIVILTIASVLLLPFARPALFPDVVVVVASTLAIVGIASRRGLPIWIALGAWLGLAVTGLTSFGFVPLLMAVLLFGWLIGRAGRSGEPRVTGRWLAAEVVTFATVVASVFVVS